MSKKIRCLLLRTNDDRRFLTRPEYVPQLIEFTNTFGAEMSIVHAAAPNLPILELDRLAPAICSPNYVPPKLAELEVLEVIRPDTIQLFQELDIEEVAVPKKKKETPIQRAETIRADIRGAFLQGNTVDLRGLAKKFKRYHLRLCTYSNHIRTVRDTLIMEGHEIEKAGVGSYRMVK